jgi:hypothetical protein
MRDSCCYRGEFDLEPMPGGDIEDGRHMVSAPDLIASFVNGWRLARGTNDEPPAADVARAVRYSVAIVEHVLREMVEEDW